MTPTCSPTRRPRGYAEADPSADVDGFDAASKTASSPPSALAPV
ncbi:MAG: hypothetical protein ACLTXI_01765 [Collinsella sp.]